MTLKHIAIVAAALALAPVAIAQTTGQQEPQIKPTGPGPGASQETSDRSPGKESMTPQNQKDTAGNKTSDRSGNKNVKVDHQPGAAGTAGTSSSVEGASSGEAGSGNSSATPAAPDASGNTSIPAADPPASGSGN
jgi:hypothetical protein